jgi:hypothetical protein
MVFLNQPIDKQLSKKTDRYITLKGINKEPLNLILVRIQNDIEIVRRLLMNLMNSSFIYFSRSDIYLRILNLKPN